MARNHKTKLGLQTGSSPVRIVAAMLITKQAWVELPIT
jgi:hypothetical protein